MSALPNLRPGLGASLGTVLLELATFGALLFVGQQTGAYFESTMLGLIAAGIAFLSGVAFWSSGIRAPSRRR